MRLLKSYNLVDEIAIVSMLNDNLFHDVISCVTIGIWSNYGIFEVSGKMLGLLIMVTTSRRTIVSRKIEHRVVSEGISEHVE